MKKVFITALALFLAATTTGLVLAQSKSSTPVNSNIKTGKILKSHKGRHHKKTRLTPASAAAAAKSK